MNYAKPETCVLVWYLFVCVFAEMDRSTVSKLIASLKDESIITAEQYVEVSGTLSCTVIVTSCGQIMGDLVFILGSLFVLQCLC